MRSRAGTPAWLRLPLGPAMNIRYEPRWKELLDGFYGRHKFTVEMTMGRLHVYFPTEATWKKSAPDWAQDLWDQAQQEASAWSQAQGIRFDIDDTAWVDFE